jgi:hypothetical protein
MLVPMQPHTDRNPTPHTPAPPHLSTLIPGTLMYTCSLPSFDLQTLWRLQLNTCHLLCEHLPPLTRIHLSFLCNLQIPVHVHLYMKAGIRLVYPWWRDSSEGGIRAPTFSSHLHPFLYYGLIFAADFGAECHKFSNISARWR